MIRFYCKSKGFYRNRSPKIWPVVRRERSALEGDNSYQTRPGEFGLRAQGCEVTFRGYSGTCRVNSPDTMGVTGRDNGENLFCHLWRNCPSLSPFPGAGELRPPGCGGHRTHGSSPPSGKHTEGYPRSAVVENSLSASKRPWTTQHRMRVCILRRACSQALWLVCFHADATLMNQTLISEDRRVLSSLRGGEIRKKQRPKEERNLLS